MADRTSTPKEIQAWVAASNSAWFRSILDSGKDEYRFKILAALLANEKKDVRQEVFS